MTGSEVDNRYRHVIPLGGACKLTRLLRLHGLRDSSYPFDWNVGTPQAVLRLIESGFGGFLQPDGMVVQGGRALDLGSGITFPNDFDAASPPEERLPEVREKYARRIRRFQTAVTQPTLFLRFARDEKELDWMLSHAMDVLDILRSTHPGNDLVVVTSGVDALPQTTSLPVYQFDDPAFCRMLVRLDYPWPARLMNMCGYLMSRLRRSLRRKVRMRTRLRGAFRRFPRPRPASRLVS